jgi:hypothetical protein
MTIRVSSLLIKCFRQGNCDIEFSIFRHRQVWNFQNTKESEWDQNFAEDFWKQRKRKREVPKLNEIEQKHSFIVEILLKFCKILLNFVKFC